MANKPDFDILEGWVTRKVMIRTATKTIVLAKRIDRRNNQLTELKLSVAMDVNIMEGNANVPTNVFSPLAPESDITLSFPATYLSEIKIYVSQEKYYRYC